MPTILWRTAPLACVVAAVMAGCTGGSDGADQAADEISGSAGAVAVEKVVAGQLARNGVSLETGPVCTPDLDRSGSSLSGRVECIGTATDGRDVNATFEGSLSTSGCDGTLVVMVGAERVVDVKAPEGCLVAN